MKFKINRDALSKLLTTAAGAIGHSAQLPIHHNVLLLATGERLEVTGANPDFSISSGIRLKADKPGSTTVSARKLKDIVARMPAGDVLLEADDKFGLSLKSGNSSYRINGLDPQQFQALPAPGKAQAFSLEQSKLKTLVTGCAFAVCKDNSRFALLGVMLETTAKGIRSAAADGRRLAVKAEDGKFSKGSLLKATIPSKAASEIGGLFDGKEPVEVVIGESKILLKSASASCISKLIDAAERASLVTSDKSSSIKLMFGKKNVMITASSAEHGDAAEDIECRLKGSPVQIQVNPRYFIEPLTAISEKQVVISLNDSKSPFMIADGKGFSCMISPILPQ